MALLLKPFTLQPYGHERGNNMEQEEKVALKWTALIVVGVIIFGLAMSWVTMGNDFFLYKFFAPKQEAVRRQVFEQTKSYNQGMVQELENFYAEYSKGTTSQKDSIAQIVNHRYADYQNERLPGYLVQFLADCRGNR